jgi:hypothetical protein
MKTLHPNAELGALLDLLSLAGCQTSRKLNLLGQNPFAVWAATTPTGRGVSSHIGKEERARQWPPFIFIF